MKQFDWVLINLEVYNEWAHEVTRMGISAFFNIPREYIAIIDSPTSYWWSGEICHHLKVSEVEGGPSLMLSVPEKFLTLYKAF